ncbi:MAG: arylesterase [Burkholderiaceae bacterium]|nr:arylesterase [Burkholderiaceae bacterium]
MHLRRRTWMLHFSLCAMLALAPMGQAQAAAPNPARRIVVLGDSMSAEYGLARGSGWVALLTQRLADQHMAATVLNASISGDTSSGGRSRLPALLQSQHPTHLLIELGGNDALRGLPLRMTQDNLQAMIEAAKAAGAKVLLIGIQVPPNYGSAYTRDFAAMYTQLAQHEKVALVPFLLAGVADRPDMQDWFQADRIHPLAKAHPLMLDNVWRVMKPWM